MFYNNNNYNILDEEDSDDTEFLEYEYDSNPINGTLNINTSTTAYHPRHNNTPHANDNNNNNNNTNNTPHDNITQLIPERIRLLLDRFSIHEYNSSTGAPSPANTLLIESIPEIIIDETFLNNNFHHTDIIECSICKITIQIHDKIKILTCKHYFHTKCIVTWLNIHASCPLCRYRLNTTTNTTNTSDTTDTSDEDRLQNLRRRRQSRRTLRNETPSNSNSGARTPYNDPHTAAAATQLIQAVTTVLDQYKSSINEDNDQRVVRFRLDHNNRRHNRLRTRTRTPHSSRSNTKTRNSLPELPLLLPLSPKHMKHHSSPPSINATATVTPHNNNNEDESDHNNNNNEEVISASKIQRDFCKWNTKRRRSRLDSNNNNNGHTIIYNSNYNQNYIYNNNYTCDEEDKKMNLKSNATTPSPAPPRNHKVPVPVPVPSYNTSFGTEFSNQTVLIKNGTFSNSGQTSPNFCEEQSFEELFTFSNENTPAPVVHVQDNIYSFMSCEQLENAKKRHKNILNKHQHIVEQIQAEKNKRMLHSFWKCPECLKNPRSFMFLPCRHLGLCQKCNLQKISKMMKCSTCKCAIRQKIPINFSND